MQPGVKNPPPQAAANTPPSTRADAMRAAFARSNSTTAFASMTNVRGSPIPGNWRQAMGQGVTSLDAYEAPTMEELKRKIPSSPSAPRPVAVVEPVRPLQASPSLSVSRPLIPSSPTISRPLGVPPLRVAIGSSLPRSKPASGPPAPDPVVAPAERFEKMVERARRQEEQDAQSTAPRRRATSEPSFPSWEILNVAEAKDSEKYGPPASARSDDSGGSRSQSMSESETSDHSSQFSEADVSPRDALTAGDTLLLSEDETGGKAVVAGTVERLVSLLADENAPDKNFVDVMLKTHFYFLESHKLLRLLMERFRDASPLPLSVSNPLPMALAASPSLPILHSSAHSATATAWNCETYLTSRGFPLRPATSATTAAGLPSSPSVAQPTSASSPATVTPTNPASGPDRQVYIQIRVVNVLKHWIENESDDFDDPLFRQSLLSYLERLRSQGDKCERWANHLHGLLLARRQQPARQIPKPLLPKRMTEKHWNGEVTFLDIHPLELARQMTLAEWREFAAIKKREYFHKAWAKGESSAGYAPNIGASIARFNRISYWIATEILLTPSPKQRITVLSRFIELAKHLEELNNFNGMMEVLSALNFSFIKRLKSVWKQVPSKLTKVVKKLDDLMDQAGNYRNYRGALLTRGAPVLPFQGVYLTDLTFIEEKPDRLVNGMVNYEKLVLVHKVLSEIQRHQGLPYNFEPVDCIQEFLKNPGLVLGDEQLWSHSKKCEPSVEAPLNQQDPGATIIFNPAPYASTLDQIEEKERVLNKLQRETSDRALAGKMLQEKKEKKEKPRPAQTKDPLKKPRTVASSLSAVTNILSVPTPSTPSHSHSHSHSAHSHSHSSSPSHHHSSSHHSSPSHSPAPPHLGPPTNSLMPSSSSGSPGLALRRGSGAGEGSPVLAPAQPKSPKESVLNFNKPVLSASNSDSMHMMQQRRIEREKERERNSPARTAVVVVGTPPGTGLATRSDAVRLETRDRSNSTSSEISIGDRSGSSSALSTDRSGGSAGKEAKDGKDTKEKKEKHRHHRDK